MFTDVPDFSTINGSCKPAQVMDVIATLFKQFDVLIEKYECNKVLSLLDSYLIVSGAPNVNESHAVNILNLALGIIYAGRSVIVPELNLPVRVRVGISCGSIVAGVVSHEKPRYCIFGHTVNVAKQICGASHPGKILVTNSVRTTVTKHQSSLFVFRQHQPIECGSMKMLTHFLEKNEKLSVWEIVGIEKDPTQSIDGYKELSDTETDEVWEKVKANVTRKQQ
ncbi:adenylate/guanylate cyclase catalytic domain protein, partial [Teladorsagia circumcincta]